MKNILLIITVCLSLGAFAQTAKKYTKIGDMAPTVTLEALNTSSAQSFDLQDLKGKVVLLDFWATWCSPCIAGMPHLDALQMAFGKKLQVIAVSDEKKERLKRFIKNTQYQFRFARNDDGLSSVFKYKILPHSVLIDENGKVVAITSPEQITKEVIQKVIDGKQISLPVKNDYYVFDPKVDYFKADANVKTWFILKPHMPGFPAYSKRHPRGTFANRRITAYNLTIPSLFELAFRTSNSRTVLEFDKSLVAWKNKQNRYSMDVIVNNPAELQATLKAQLEIALPFKARLEKRKHSVVVITQKKNGLQAQKSSLKTSYAGKRGSFQSKGASLEDFRNYLESFTVFGNTPV